MFIYTSNNIYIKTYNLNDNNFNVLEKTLKGIRGVRLCNRKVLRAPGARTKHFELYFCRSTNYIYIVYK